MGRSQRLGKKRQQAAFGELEAAARVPQGPFLRQVDHKIDWQPLQAELEGLNPSRRGRPSYPLLMLFKALLLQCWYKLSDPGLEEAIRDRLSFQRFLGLGLTDPVPDETTLCRVRGLLTRKGVGPRLLGLLDEQLQGQGLIGRQGSLIDATLLKAQPRPPKKGRPALTRRPIGPAKAKMGTLATRPISPWTKAAAWCVGSS